MHEHGLPGIPEWGRCGVMGVVNVTPDSFSDGGRWESPDAAVKRALMLVEDGADLVDVGGESTRPGAVRVPPEVERERVLPVVRALAAEGVVVSVDTMRAALAEEAVAAGARIVNDVTGGLADPAMARVVAATGVPFVAMRWSGPATTAAAPATPATPAGTAVAPAVTAREATTAREAVTVLGRRVAALIGAGVRPEQLVVDPGLGFTASREEDWALLADLGAWRELGRPVLVAASRKRFLGELLADPATATPRPARERDDATAAVTVLAALGGAWAVRVHEVRASADAVRVAARVTAEAGSRVTAAAGLPS